MIISIIVILCGLLLAQQAHYSFKREAWKSEQAEISYRELEEFREDFEKYKKRVDALTLRAGFTT